MVLLNPLNSSDPARGASFKVNSGIAPDICIFGTGYPQLPYFLIAAYMSFREAAVGFYQHAYTQACKCPDDQYDAYYKKL